MSTTKRVYTNKEVIHEKQYDQKIPFFVTFLTGAGLIATGIAVFLAWVFKTNLIHFGTMAVVFNLIAYKFFAPRWTELEEIYTVKLIYKTLAQIKSFSLKNKNV